MIPVKPVTVRESRGHASALSNQSLELPGDWDKVTQVRDTGRFLLPSGTAFVERDVLGVAEEVERVTQGKCRIASCSCGKCLSKGHYPHVVLELGRRGRTYPVFGFTNFGPHVLQRLRQIHVDTGHHKKALKKNEEIRRQLKAKAAEVQEERLEVVASALESHKFSWRGPDGLQTRA